MPRPSRIEIPQIFASLDGIRADYDATRTSRFRRRRSGVDSVGHGADYHLRDPWAHMKMIELARDMDRNDAMLGQTITRSCRNTLQDGPSLDPQTTDPDLNEELKARWSEYSGDEEQCDIAGEMTVHQMAFVALRSMMVDGDCYALPLKSGHLEMV